MPRRFDQASKNSGALEEGNGCRVGPRRERLREVATSARGKAMKDERQLLDAVRQAPFLGRTLERVEDAALLTGRGHYGDDLGVKPGTLHAAILRSPHAHALLKDVDPRDAERQPGVRAVLTGRDVQAWSQPFVVGVKQPMEHWALAIDRVRYVGEPVAVVVAENRYLAEDALDAIKVVYETLPVAVEIEQAIAPDAPVLHPAVGSNVVSDRSFRYGDPEAAFARAPHR